MNLGALLKKARKAKGFTLRQVEDNTNISNAYLSQLENSKILSPSFKIIKTLSDYYEISISELLNVKPEHKFSQWTELNCIVSLLTNDEICDLCKYGNFLIHKRTLT